MKNTEKTKPTEVASDMTPSELMEQLHNPQTKFAFLLGNGINKYTYRKEGINIDVSWESLLRETASRLNVLSLLPSLNPQDRGVSLTEYYSLIILTGIKESKLQNTITSIVNSWPLTTIHEQITESLLNYNRPVLTTNNDCLLHKGLERHWKRKHWKFIKDGSVFPVHKYWAKTGCDGFSLWHINGCVDKSESLRFGLIDYTKLIFRVFYLWKKELTQGTWVKLLANQPLCIVGLGLNETEIFLRSFLLRKRKKKHGCLGWYCYTIHDEMPYGKSMLLRHMGISPVMFSSYDEMYTTLFPAISKENDKGCNNTFQQR